ncbi:MAG: response regulator [bacterium]|nr:response regulator [bacterium]
MVSALIVSNDATNSETLIRLVTSAGLYPRSVASVGAAVEWFAIHTFDYIIVDNNVGMEQAIALIRQGWDKHPLMAAVLVSLAGEMANPWTARLMGISVYEGSDATAQLETELKVYSSKQDRQPGAGLLIVEDLDAPRYIISTFVESFRLGPVDSARDSIEAMEILHRTPSAYFCVLTDINMPGESGISLIRKIRRDEDLCHIPVVVLTAHPTGDNLVECLAAGASGFLVKPPKKEALKNELTKAKRTYLRKQSPRVCGVEDAIHLEEALKRVNLRL